MLSLQTPKWLWPEGWHWPGSIQRRNCWASPKLKRFETFPASSVFPISASPMPEALTARAFPAAASLSFLLSVLEAAAFHTALFCLRPLWSAKVRNSCAKAPWDTARLTEPLGGEAEPTFLTDAKYLCSVCTKRDFHIMYMRSCAQFFQTGKPNRCSYSAESHWVLHVGTLMACSETPCSPGAAWPCRCLALCCAQLQSHWVVEARHKDWMWWHVQSGFQYLLGPVQCKT